MSETAQEALLFFGGFIGVVLLIIIVRLLFFYYQDYSIYKRNTTEQSNAWDYGSKKDFLREYNNRIWTLRAAVYLEDSNGSFIKTDMIRFENYGMVLGQFAYIWYISWIKTQLRPSRHKKGIWNKSNVEIILENQRKENL